MRIDTGTVAVLGLGYVGLPTALALTAKGFRVVGIDVSERRLRTVRNRRVDLLPADLERLDAALDDGGLELSSAFRAAADAGSIVICVPTPVDEHSVPDLSFVEAACTEAVAHARRGQIVILTSTTYVGTTRRLLASPLAKRGFTLGDDIFVAFSPERIDPGNASHPQRSVPRVLGGATRTCTLEALAVVGQLAEQVHTVSSLELAEFTKLYENTFRAVNIAFANEMADAARVLGLDVMEAIDAASTKPYGFMPFKPGPGVGGHCIPCDPHYLLWQLRAQKQECRLVHQAMAAISERPRQVVERAAAVLAAGGLPLAGAEVLVVGVSYKPGVEDFRESPAVEILDRLVAAGARVQYHDSLVPTLPLRNGLVLRSNERPSAGEFDLVIIHGVHPHADTAWLQECRRVLDATYQCTSLPHRSTL